MEKVIVRAGQAVKTYPFTAPSPLSAFTAELCPLPCGGHGRCGKCKVIAKGKLSPLSAEEKSLLTPQEQRSGVRLACCALALGSCEIVVGYTAAQVQTAAAALAQEWEGGSLFGDAGWAFAADIGTTTIAAYLVSLQGRLGESPAASGANCQARFGADVITRIERSMEIGIKPLRDCLLDQLDGLFTQLAQEQQVSLRAVKGVVLAGNTTLLHFAAGLDPAGIACAPYTPQSLFGVLEAARGFFPSLPPAAQVYFAPCVSAFVGGDISCAILACGMRPNDLLIDVGTNGEMALLLPGGRFLCCSTAAGPAFEGVGLRFGMPAADGVIDAVQTDGSGLRCHIIGGGKARGLCGTGAISALAALCKNGAVDETGLLDEQYGGAFPLQDGVQLTQEDIRALQLAKAAVAAGVDTLLERAGISPEQVGRVFLAGGFGSHIRPSDAARIGLFPRALAGKVQAVGNAAGRGACICARWESAIQQAQQACLRSDTLDLASDLFFQERYIEQMLFPTG